MSKTFTVTAPDGKRYRVTGPDGATQEEAVNRAKAQRSRKELEALKKRLTGPQTVAAFGDDLIENIFPHWGDEIAAANKVSRTNILNPANWPGAAATVGARLGRGEPVGKEFREAQKTFRDTQIRYDDEHPRLAAGSTLGGIGASLLLPGGAALKGASTVAKVGQAAKVGALYGTVAGAGEGEGLVDRAYNALTNGIMMGGFGALSPLALKAGGSALQQARLRVPGVDAALAKVGNGLQHITNAGRSAVGKPRLPIAPPSVRAKPQANRMIADTIGRGGIRQGPGAPQAATATPMAVADEVERRAAMNVPAMVGDVTEPLTHTAGWASRGPGPGQSMVRRAVANRKAEDALRMRQHVTDTMGPVVDPQLQMENHMAQARAAAAPGYKAAYAEPMVVTPEIEAIMQTPAFQEAVPYAVRNIRNGLGDPTGLGFRMDADGNIAGAQTLTVEGFDQVLRAMKDSGRAAADINPITGKVINNSNSVGINARAGDLKDQLAAQNPAYADVTGRYADDMAVRDAFGQGQDVASLTGHEINAQARSLPESAHGSWSIGARSAIADEASRFGATQPNGDAAGHLRTILGDDTKQDAIGQMMGNTGAVRGLHDRLDAEQQAHGLWQEVQRNQGASRRATVDGLDAQMGGNGPGSLSLRGRAGDMLSGMLDKAEPQYRKDVRNHVSGIVSEQDPQAVRAAMAEVAAQAQRDADFQTLLQNVQLRGLQGTFATLEPNRNYSN
ncbi:MAG TPA: hypothetical protein VF463_10055 [Sphingobium sp.]